jgi:hypothetical protein
MRVSRACRLAVLGGLLLAAEARAQPPAAIRGPAPDVLVPPSPVLFPNLSVEKPQTPAGPAFAPGSAGPYAVSTHEDLVPPLTTLEQSPVEPGLYGAVDIGIVRPHVSARTAANDVLPMSLRVPVADQDWVPSPRVELGYRLPDGCADLRLGYRLLCDSGTDSTVLGNLHSRIDVNSIDLDYVSNEWLVDVIPDLIRTLRPFFGLRLASGYFSTELELPFTLRLTSQFYGAGPRFGIEWRKPVQSSIEIYFRGEATGLLGKTQQTATAAFLTGSTPWQSNAVGVLSAELGVSWRPINADGFRMTAGYQIEQWWNIGRTDYGNADLTVQGIFLRAEWHY